MQIMILTLIKKLGSELLLSLLQEIVLMLSARSDNTVGTQSVLEVQEIIKRNHLVTDVHGDSPKKFRRFGSRR